MAGKNEINKNEIKKKEVIKLCNNYTKIISREELEKYKKLKLNLSKNGTGDRWCNKTFIYTTVYKKSTTLCNSNDIEKHIIPEEILKDFQSKSEENNNKKIIGIFPHCLNTNKTNRRIKEDILKHYKKIPCANCGSNRDLTCDHKNALYNEDRVMDVKTQKIDDFQSLCNKCNSIKRGIVIKEKKSGIRLSGKKIENIKFLGVDFIEGTEKLESDGIGLKGTYWYDINKFKEEALNIYIKKNLKKGGK
jgi:5-methylcytosine-specific restriction endonuclease McrA